MTVDHIVCIVLLCRVITRGAEALGQRKREQVEVAGPTTVVSANPGCEIQLRAHLDRSYRVLHPIELYWEALNR